MATYHNIYNYYEDGVGDVRLVFSLSDTYAGVFENDGLLCNVFSIKSTKKDLEVAQGITAQDELQITCNEADILTDTDQDAFDLFFSARDADNRVFCAVFININSSTVDCSFDNADMIAVIQPDMKGKASRWHGANYNASPAPVREWSARANNFSEAILDKFDTKDLINGLTVDSVEIIPPISNTWISEHVADYKGWFHASRYGAERKGVFNDLVDLGEVLTKLMEQFATALNNKGLTGYTVTLDDIVFDYEFAPAKPRRDSLAEVVNNKDLGFGSITVVSTIATADSTVNYDVADFEGYEPDIDHRKNVDLYGEPDERLLIHWRMLKPTKEEEKLSFWSRKTFLDFLYAIGYSFGMYAMIYNTDPNHLHIKFVNRKNLTKWEVYPVGATSDDIDIKPTSDSNNAYSGSGSMYTADGGDTYVRQYASAPTPSEKRSKQKDGEALLLTASRSFCKIGEDGYAGDDGSVIYSMLLPHNGTILQKINDIWVPQHRAAGISTALYMRSTQNHDLLHLDSGEYYITPVSRIVVRVDGVAYWFYSLSDYANYINARAGKYYEFERTIEVPYLCAFSQSSDGSSPSWKHIALGCTKNYDGISYTIIGIERNYEARTTKLRMQLTSRFAFTEVGSVDFDGSGSAAGSVTTGDYADNKDNTFIAASAIKAGDAVMITEDATVKRAENTSATYATTIGIALQSAEPGALIRVALPGSVLTSSRYSFTPGERLFVRKTIPPTLNISNELLTVANAAVTEQSVIEIGVAVTESSFALSSPFEYLLEDLL